MKIYLDDKSGSKEKRNAAYNIAVLLYELSYAEKSYKWTKKAVSLMTPQEVKKFQSTFALITSDIFGRRLIKEAAEANSMIFKKMCNMRTKYLNMFYKNSVLLHLSENNLATAKKIIDKGNSCRISNSTKNNMKLDYLKALIDLKRWSQAEEVMENLAKNKKNYPKLIYPLSQLRRAYAEVGRREEGRNINTKILSYHKYSKAKKLSIPLESLDVISELYVARLIKKVEKLKKYKIRIS